MKTYSTCDVIKAICENPKLKFQTEFSDGLIWETFSRTDCPGIRCIYGKGRSTENEDFLTTDSNTMSRKWTLVQEPVPFMEAANSGKNIRPESIKDRGFNSLVYWLGFMVSSCAHGFKGIELINGDWYIEEEQ